METINENMLAIGRVKRYKIRQLQQVEAAYGEFGTSYIFAEHFGAYSKWFALLNLRESEHLMAFRWVLYQLVLMFKKMHDVGFLRPDLDLFRSVILQPSGKLKIFVNHTKPPTETYKNSYAEKERPFQ